MSIDDYFMQEGEIEEKDPITGKIVRHLLSNYKITVTFLYQITSHDFTV